MESIKIKSNARKSTYSGRPSVAHQEQLRMRQALKQESNANHVPVKASPTTWKRSGWSLSARVRQSTKDELLTPMVITKDKESTPEAAALNSDMSSESGNVENGASSEKKSPDQRSLWSLFSAPNAKEKVDENVDENVSRVDSITNGSGKSDDEHLTPQRVRKIPSRDPRIRKREESEAELTKKTCSTSFNLLSKMKPLKNASRNFFAHLGKKPEHDRVTLKSQNEASNAATERHDSRVGNRTTVVSRNKHLDGNRKESSKRVENHEQNCNILHLREQAKTCPSTRDKKENSVMVEHSRIKESDSNTKNNRGENALPGSGELVSANRNQDKDSSLAEDVMSDTTSPTKHEEGPSKDIAMPTLTLPAEIEHNRYPSNVSSEVDESECLFIDEQAHVDSPSYNDEDSSKVQDEEEDHVLRVWSLQSEGETNNDFQNVDLSGSFGGDANSSLGLDDSLPSVGNESLNSLGVSKTENDARFVERLHEVEKSGALSKSCSEKILETANATLKNAENHMHRSRNLEEGPPKLQAQPNTHHLLQELDSLLECSTFQSDSYSNMPLEAFDSNRKLEASQDSTMQFEDSEPLNTQYEEIEGTCGTDSLDQIIESGHSNATESARNIFSLFGGGKKPLSPKNIVKLQIDRGNPYSSSYLSAFSKDSIVLSGSCSGERNKATRTEHSEHNTANTLSNNKAPDTGLPTLSFRNMSHDTPSIFLSGNKSSDHGLPSLTNIKSPGTSIPSLTPETGTGDGQGSRQNDIPLQSSQPPELCLEVNPSSLGEKEVSWSSPIFPAPHQENVDNIPFLAFETRDDLISYSKAMKLKMQRKSTQTNKVPSKKCVYPAVKNVKMKRKRKNPIEAKIKALEQDLLWSMESKGLTEIVHPVLSRKGVALDAVKKNDLVVNVRNEELERLSYKKPKHKKMHRSKSEIDHSSDARGQGRLSNSVELSGSRHGHFSSLHVRKSSVDKDHETEHAENPSDTGKVVGLKHGHFPDLQKSISKVQSSEQSNEETEMKGSEPRHQEWAICQKELHATSERPSLKLKLITKAKANSTSPTKVEQSPLALSTKPRESTVPVKSPTSHIPVNVQQLHLPSSSPVTKSVVPVASKPKQENTQLVENKPQPSARLPEEESLPFKPFEKPVASKKSAFVSDALEDLLQGVGINNKMKSLISPSTISVNNAKVVFKVPSRQSHSVKTLDMALKRQKPLNVASPNYSSLLFKDSYTEHRDGKKKKKKKKKEKHKDKNKYRIKDGFVFGTGPDNLVRKLPKLPFASYGKTLARPLFARERQDASRVGEKSKGFLEVRNVLSLSGKAPGKRQSDESEMQGTKKIKQEPEQSNEDQPYADESLPPILNINLSPSGKDGDLLQEESNIACKESKSEEGQAPSEIKVVQKCEEYCRLGCICSSLDKSRPVQELSNHCRKVDCMFDCICKKTSSQSMTGTRIRRPPTHARDMLFYDDTYKFWKVGDPENTAVGMKKLQLLDHLPECEKRNLVSTCARTRHFVTDKPDKWIKLKRKQQGDEADQHVEKKRAAESNVAHPLASESSKTRLTNSNQDLQHGTQSNVKQQKSLHRKKQFIPLVFPTESRQKKQVSDQASEAVDSKSKVKNIPSAQTTAPLSLSTTSSQGQTPQGTSTFLPVSKQYLLNGNLMNMVMLPNGSRILIPASCGPLTVEESKPSHTSEARLLAPKVKCAQYETSTIPVQLAKPTMNTSMQSTVQNEDGLKLPTEQIGSSVSSATSGHQRPVLPVQFQLTSSGIVLKPGVVATTSAAAAPVTTVRSKVSQGTMSQTVQNEDGLKLPTEQIGSSVSSATSGHQRPVLPVQLQLTSSGIILKPGVVATTSSAAAPVTTMRSNVSQGTMSQINHSTLQTSDPSENSTFPATVPQPLFKAPVSSKGTEPGVQLNVVRQAELPKLNSDEKKISTAVPAQTCLVKPLVTSNTCVPLATSSTKQDAAVSLQEQEHNVTESVTQVCSPSESASHEDKEEIDSATSKAFLGVSGVSQMRLTKTFYMDIKDEFMCIMMLTDAEFEWADTMECEVKQGIAKILNPRKPKQNVQLPEDMELNLLSKGDGWIRFRLTKHKSAERSEDVIAEESKKTIGSAADGSNTFTFVPGTSKSVTEKPETNIKAVTSNVSKRTPSKSNMTPGVPGSSPGKSYAASNTHDKSQSMSDSGMETSKKLSSSLPEFDKLSEIVKRTSVDDEDGLSPVKKVTRNVSDWLHDPKIQKPWELQSYTGVKGPWFTTEKEGVKVVLQRNKDKRSPFGKGGKSPSKPMPQRISKRPSTSPLLVISPRKSPKCEETAFQNRMDNDADNDADSCEGKSLAKDEGEASENVHSVEMEHNEKAETPVNEIFQTSEESAEDKEEHSQESTELITRTEHLNKENHYSLSEIADLLLDSNAISTVSTCISQIDNGLQEEASNTLVDTSNNSKMNEKTVIDGQSEQQSKFIDSGGSDPPKAVSPSPDASIDDEMDAEGEIGIEDAEGTLGIEHFARFSEEDVYGPLDVDEEVSCSFDLTADCNDDDNSSVASLRIDDGITNDISNADLGMSTSLPKEHIQETSETPEVREDPQKNLTLPATSKDRVCTDLTDPPQKDSQSSKDESNSDAGILPHTENTPEVPVLGEHVSENQPSLAEDIIQTETTSVKYPNVLPKKSPTLNIKFVATSNENCTSPICMSPVCPSPICMSPSSEVLSENTQDRSPTPVKDNDPSDAGLSETDNFTSPICTSPVCPSSICMSPLSEVLSENTQDKSPTPVKDNDPSVAGLSDTDNLTSPIYTSPVCPSPICMSPSSEVLSDNTQDKSPTPVKDHDQSDAGSSDTEVDVVNTDDDVEVDVESIIGVTPAVQNLNPYSSLRNITSRLSSKLRKEQEMDMAKKKIKLKSSSNPSFKLSIGHSFGSPRHNKKYKSSGSLPLKMNPQLSTTTHVKSKKKRSKRKSPVCPAKQWDSPMFQVVYNEKSSVEEEKDEEKAYGPNSTHNLLERRRREELRKTFLELSDAIHGSAQERVPPKIHILKQALLEIKRLTNTEKVLLQEKEHFQKQQRRLVYVHSNLLHHARCSGQIVFPEGSRLAESIERIRAGLSKHIPASSLGSKHIQDSSTDLEGKGRERKAPKNLEQILDSHITKKDSSAERSGHASRVFKKKKGKHISATSFRSKDIQDSSADLESKGKERKAPKTFEEIYDSHITKKDSSAERSGNAYGVFKKKKSKKKSCSLRSKTKSSSSRNEAFSHYPTTKDLPGINKHMHYIPLTRKDLKASLSKVQKEDQESAIDLSVPSGSRQLSHSRHGVYSIGDYDSSSNEEESLPIDCYVSSSDEPWEEDEEGFGIDYDEEPYSDDGFIPESEDEDTANDKKLEKSRAFSSDGDEKKGESDQDIVTINIDLNDFEQENVESMGDSESSAEFTGIKRVVPKVKQMSHRKEKTFVEIADSDDDLLVIAEEAGSTDDKLKKKENERGTLKSQDGRTVLEVHGSQSIAKKPSEADTGTKKVSSIPLVSQCTPVSKTSQDSSQSTRPIEPQGKGSGVKQNKAPLVNVIDEIMNRLAGGTVTSANSSAGEKTDEALGPSRVGFDVSASNSDDREKGQEKLLNKSSTSAVIVTDSIQSKDRQSLAVSLKPKGDVSLSKDQRSSHGGVQPSGVILDDCDSSSDKKISTAVGLASNSIHHRENYVSDTSLKHNEDEHPSDITLHDSDSSSADNVDNQESTSALTATAANSMQHQEEKGTALSWKNKEPAQARGVMLDDSELSSDDEVDGQQSTTALTAISLNDSYHEKENSPPVGEQESVASTSHSKFTASVSNDLQRAVGKHSAVTLQKNTGVLQMTGALADLISSVKTRVRNDDAIDSSDDSESEEEDVEDEIEDEDSDDGSNDEESSDDEEMEVEKDEDNVAEYGSGSNDSESKKQDITDIDKDEADPSHASEEKGQRDEKPEGNSVDQNIPESFNSAVGSEGEVEHREDTSADEAAKDPSFVAEEKDQGTLKQGKSSISDGSTSPPFFAKAFEGENEIQDGFSVGEDVTDDDAACLSYAAMGNDEDHEALFDAGNPSSPSSLISLDMNIASDDDIEDTMDDLDEDPNAPSLQPPRTSSIAGTSTDETKSRPQETSSSAEPSPGGHQKSSSSSKQDSTLDEAISFLDIEKNSDGTLNVVLKGDYDDEKLDELFEKPGVMDYIMTAAAKKP